MQITIPLGFYWNEHSKSKYKDCLQSLHVSTKLNELFTSPSLKPAELALEIKNILMDNTITANLRPIKESNKRQQKDKPWFDKECRDIKNSLKRFCKNLKQDPCDPSIRSAILDLKRKLKKVVLAKKRRNFI